MTIVRLASLLTERDLACSAETLMACAGEFGNKVSFACIAEKYMAWKYFVPGLKNSGRALVIDAALGLDSLSLSRNFKEIISVSASAPMAEIIKSRILHHGVGNCSTQVADFKELPFSNNLFDYVFIKDISIVLRELSSGEDIDVFINEISRVMNNDGYFVFGFNNSKGFFRSRIIFGEKTEFKCIQSLIRKIEKNKKIIKVIKVYPDIYQFSDIYDDSCVKYSFSKDTVKKLLPYKYSPGAICIFGPADEVVENSFVGDLKQVLGERVLIEKAITGNPNILILFASIDGAKHIVRIPLCDSTKSRLQNQYDVLKRLAEEQTVISESVPMQGVPVTLRGETVFVEQRLSGMTVSPGSKRFDCCVEQGHAWIRDFHILTKRKRLVDQSRLDQYLLNPLSGIEKILSEDKYLKIITKLKERFTQKYLNRDINFVCMHGDYKIDNILFDNKYKKVNGVIDWDLSSLDGLPVVDLLFFTSYNSFLNNISTNISNEIIKTLFLSSFCSDEVLNYLKNLDLENDDILYFGIMTWVYHVLYRTTGHMKFSSGWVCENLHKPLELIDEHFPF